MPSTFTHIFVGGALGRTYTDEKMPVKFWVLAVVCSILPDIDIVGFYLGVKYSSLFGHRGFFHSLTFALLVSAFVSLTLFPGIRRFSKKWWGLFAFFFIVTASHGFLDALTDRGLGIGFFIPFDNTRYHMPWRPIYASPMSIPKFFGHAGFEVLLREIVWIWLPMIALSAGAALVRKMKKNRLPS